MFPLRYSKKAFFSASILSALASRDKERAVVGSLREGVANRKEEEEGGGMLWEARPLDWYATDTTPWFKVKNNRPPLYTPVADTQFNRLITRPSPTPVLDCLQFTNMEGEGPGEGAGSSHMCDISHQTQIDREYTVTLNNQLSHTTRFPLPFTLHICIL